MRRDAGLLAAATLVAFLLPAAAHGQSVCSIRANFLSELRIRHDETVGFRALAANGSLLEILVSPGGKTWTVLITRPGGFSCVVAVGSDFEVLPPPVKGEPS